MNQSGHDHQYCRTGLQEACSYHGGETKESKADGKVVAGMAKEEMAVNATTMTMMGLTKPALRRLANDQTTYPIPMVGPDLVGKTNPRLPATARR